jgi:hypothetical protein
MKKINRKIISMIFIVILVVFATSITSMASENKNRHKFIYITHDMEWTEKGINKGDIYEVEWVRTSAGEFKYYIYMNDFVLLKDQKTIGQVVNKLYDRHHDNIAVDVILKTGERVNGLEYDDVQGRMKKQNLSDYTHSFSDISDVSTPTDPSIVNNLKNDGWEVVHEYALLDNYTAYTHNFGHYYIEYIPNLLSAWRSNNQYAAFDRGVLNIFKEEDDGHDKNKVHYGDYGSYNPKLYEYMIILNDDPSEYRISIKNVNNIGVSEDIEGDTFDDVPETIPTSNTIHVPTGSAFRLRANNKAFAHVLRRYNPIPADIKSVKVVQSGSNSVIATANLKNVGMPSVEEYGHILSTNSDLTYQNNQQIKKYGYAYSSTFYNSKFDGLSEGVTYYIRPYAITEIGIYYGEIQSFHLNRPPSINVVKPTVGQSIHKGDVANFKATASDPDRDNLTYNIKIGTTNGGVDIYNGVPNGIKSNTQCTHNQSINTGLTWNARNNRYEKNVYATITVNDGKGKSDSKNTSFKIVNYKPNIEITTAPSTYNYGLYEPFTIQGKVWDVHRDRITISATINGKTVSTTVNNVPSSKPAGTNFTLSWSGNKSPSEGEYKNIVFNISDVYGGTNSKTWTGTIVVEDILKKIEEKIDHHINLNSDEDVRTIVINTNTKVSASTRNNEILARIRKKLMNRDLNLYFIGKDQETINYIKSRLNLQ